MKFLFLTCILSICFFFLNAQQNNQVVIGKIDSINSNILKEQRKIWIHLPASATDGLHPKKRFPVIYLLDCDWNFSSAVAITDFLTTVNGNSFFPEMIIVGIMNTERTRDLTPTHVSGGLWADDHIKKVSGGGESFLSFIEKELMPHIDSMYRTSSYRMMIGHSLGGLMAIHSLLHHRNLFNSYIAIDPSMWWDERKLLNEAAQDLKSGSFNNEALFLAMAHTQDAGVDTTRVQSDTTDGTIHPRSILRLAHYVMGNPQNGLDAGFKYYDGDSHSSVPLIATYDGLHFIFKDYPLIFQDNYFNDPAFPLAEFLAKHFAMIATKYGITDEGNNFPPEDQVNNLGFFVMGKKQYSKAEDMFRMNIKNYPSGFMAYNYLGDVYSEKGDKKNAILNYKKSLSLKESDEVKKKLEKLMGK